MHILVIAVRLTFRNFGYTTAEVVRKKIAFNAVRAMLFLPALKKGLIMKILKSVSALAAALLSTTAFAGGLGLGVGIGANVGVGAELGELGVQGGGSQQTDTRVGSGQVNPVVRQSGGVQSETGIDQRTVSDGAAAASARVAANARAVASQTRPNIETQPDRHVGATANVDADLSTDLHQRSRHAHTGAQDLISNARQSARAQRMAAHTHRSRSKSDVSGNVSAKASVKQATELNSGG